MVFDKVRINLSSEFSELVQNMNRTESSAPTANGENDHFSPLHPQRIAAVKQWAEAELAKRKD